MSLFTHQLKFAFKALLGGAFAPMYDKSCGRRRTDIELLAPVGRLDDGVARSRYVHWA